MKPGYTINFPGNVVDETTGDDVFGSFALSNSWPRTTGEARDLFLDQFTGETLAEQNSYGYGAISYSVDTLVSTHMGTQLGLFSRIMMTLLCVLALWSVFSASVMFWKRRRPGTLGLPRRPVDVRLARGVAVIAIVMAVLFPIWGVTAAIVLGVRSVRHSPPAAAARRLRSAMRSWGRVSFAVCVAAFAAALVGVGCGGSDAREPSNVVAADAWAPATGECDARLRVRHTHGRPR